MKFLVSFLLLTTLISCKEVEKNPSGCDYDTVNEDGICMRSSYKGEKIIEEINQSLFIKEYYELKDSEKLGHEVYDLQMDKVQKELNEGNQVGNYQVFIKKLEKNLEFLSDKVKKLNEIYDSSYSDGLYNQIRKTETLIEEMTRLKESFEDFSKMSLLGSSYDSMSDDERVEYAQKYDGAVADLKKIADMEKVALGKFHLEVTYDREAGYRHTLNIFYQLEDRNSQIGDDLRNGVERYFLADEACQDAQLQVCISDFYQTVENNATIIYNKFLE